MVKKYSYDRTASDGQRFFELMSAAWRNVHYDERTGKGWAQAGSLGRIEFQESGNDPAVIVTIPAMRFKANPDTMVEILEVLNRAKGMSD